jgi:hypothetical protein
MARFDDYHRTVVGYHGTDITTALRIVNRIEGFRWSIDTARGVYVPSGGDRRVWEGSWISRNTHIQLCVRNSANLLGAWLHYPTGLGVSDVCEKLQAIAAGVDGEHQQSKEGIQGDVQSAED